MAIDENVLEGFKGCLEKEAGSDSERFIKVGIATDGLDTFGRLKISQDIDIFDNKNISSRSPELFDEVTSGSGAINYTRATSSVQLTITEASGDRALRQTRYLPYIPGKAQSIVMTGVLTDDSDAELSIVLRTSTSGSAVDTKVGRESWSDTVLGSGDNNPSNVRIDFTNAGIFSFAAQWLGVGIVKFGLSNKNGREINPYQFENSFSNDDVYMRTPTLPMRYEIVSDGSFIYSRIGYFDDNDGFFYEAKVTANAGTYTLKEICCSSSSSGGIRPIGLEYHANTRGTGSVSSLAGTDTLAVRLANTYQGEDNRKTIVCFANQFFAESENTVFELYKVISYTDNGTSWTDVNTYSGIEYAAGADIDVTLSSFHMINCAIVTANSSGSKSQSGIVGVDSVFEILDENRVLKQNFDSTQSQMFLVKAFSFTAENTTNCGCSITWLELE